MIEEINSKILNKYGSFKSIIFDLDKKLLKKDFWEKERSNIKRIVQNGKEHKKSMVMSTMKFYKKFNI